MAAGKALSLRKKKRMLYPSDFEEKIGFTQVRELIHDACLSDLGKLEAKELLFSTDHQDVLRRLQETEEFRQVLLSQDSFPSQDYFNTIPLLTQLRIENTCPEPEQLSELRLALSTFIDIVRFFNDERKETYPRLWNHLEESTKVEVQSTNASTKYEGRSKKEERRGKSTELRAQDSESSINEPVSGIWQPATGIRELIDRVLDDKSQVRDSASKELAEIRKGINRLQGGVEKRMNQIFKEVRKSGWIDEGAEVTLREGRLVIPFRSAHKRRIRGVVHDESATGQTVYVEPVELFEMNNEIRELYYAEKREIIRILTDVAVSIRPHIEELTDINYLLGNIDFIRAKARIAIKVGGVLCNHIVNHPHIQWFEAVHPLLYLSHKKAKRSVVSQEISLSAEQCVLVISGPNAGGKSICLKTVGLLQYMLQCGILPPAREDSEFGIFRKIMIDIGDEQSLENDLSTYTSKLLNMKFFLENLDGHSLFLIDEMGTGTDPSVGGAIAEAALLSMVGTGAYGVVTTHYSNLKLIASQIPDARYQMPDKKSGDQTSCIRDQAPGIRYPASGIRYPGSGILNGAMLFDTRNMKPLYKLKIGKPGSSFAIEIATSIGFPEEELQQASELIGGSQLDFERQLQALEQEKEDVTKRSGELHVADDFLDEMIIKYEKMIDEIERSKMEILEKAREEAHQLLKDSNKLIEHTIKEIRETQADKERTKKARSAIQDARTAITDSMPDARIQKPDKLSMLSDSVSGSGEKQSPAAPIRHPGSSGKPSKSSYVDIISSKQESFTLTLDLRGKRVDEAFLELQRFIDDAILLSIREVWILHGKGTGALREVTRNYLNGVKEIKSFNDEALERGGAGVTVAVFG